MNRRFWCLLALGAPLVGCAGTSSHRNPVFAESPPLSPTLLTSAVPCLSQAVVAAGGQLVRRATGFGSEAVIKLDLRVARAGATAPSLPSSHCVELTSAQALDPTDWHNPKPPPILAELAQMSGAAAVFVPIVLSEMTCGTKPGPWRWGRPVYEDDRGDVDCVESKLTFIGFLFDAQGGVLWKGVLEHDVVDVPDAAALADELMVEVPLGTPAPLRGAT